ncbi:MAG: hypothetical protein COX57_05840 [Alphaproteobacteria bacterium CG_4_10_14_0_2_um_filter_63_37]|nr:MAG: hypothetical protein COX57_05840 [Alphaproteobacteria bacterium CG_4_10_14_0_2_um_filter_63_37]
MQQVDDGNGRYSIPDPSLDPKNDPYPYFERVLALPEHAKRLDLPPPFVVFLFDHRAEIRQGIATLATVHLPTVQGKLKGVFAWALANIYGRVPDYLVTIDHYWWSAASDRQREILIFHETCHMAQAINSDGEERFTEEGDPVWAIQPHSIEEFSEVASRYGAHSDDLAGFIQAALSNGNVDGN